MGAAKTQHRLKLETHSDAKCRYKLRRLQDPGSRLEGPQSSLTTRPSCSPSPGVLSPPLRVTAKSCRSVAVLISFALLQVCTQSLRQLERRPSHGGRALRFQVRLHSLSLLQAQPASEACFDNLNASSFIMMLVKFPSQVACQWALLSSCFALLSSESPHSDSESE
jgi:hypothetical protein